MVTNDASAANQSTATPVLGSETAPVIIRISDALKKFVDFVGRWASFLILPLVLITVWDVITRKLGLTLWLTENVSSMLGSTLLQELEWHFHTGLFALVLGYGYIYNTHVRVDLVRETLHFRKKAWLEFIGCTFFMIPYCAIVIWFAIDYAHSSYAINEISASQVGLSHRWIIKSVLVVGLCVAAVAGIAVWLQMVLVLFGPQDLRFRLMTLDWPEEEGSGIEGKKRVTLDDDDEQAASGSASTSPSTSS